MEKGKHPVYQYWPWMLAAATVLLAAWAVCETLAIFATGGYTRELAGRALGRGNQGMRDVLVKAIQICTECIGLG